MKVLLLVLLAQAASPVQPAASGIVTGMVRAANGTPAAGIRVFAVPAGAPAGSPGVAAAPAALVGITQSDDSGNYRLEAPAGRYFIATGSVEAPTYFPGTVDITAARAIVVSSGSVVSSIDFAGFVPRVTGSARVAPTGVLTGEIRHSDGTPAAGAFVVAQVARALPPTTSGSTGSAGTSAALTGRVTDPMSALIPGVSVSVTNNVTPHTAQTQTDERGTFSFQSLVAGTYTVFAELPGFQPVKLDIQIGTGSPRQLDLVMRPSTTVIATPLLGVSGPLPLLSGLVPVPSTRTDSSGRYRLDVPQGVYHIAAGYLDPPTFLPGVASAANAMPVTTRPNTVVDRLDFVIPPRPPGHTVSGRVTTKTGVPLPGTEVTLRSTKQATAVLPGMADQVITVGLNGTFEFRDVLPGSYRLMALVSGIDSAFQDIAMVDSPVRLDFAFSVAVVRGRLLWEDGAPFSDPVTGLGFVAETVDNPNIVGGTILPIAGNGTFGGTLQAGLYRVHLRALPAGYSIVSITAGTANLLADALRLEQTTVADVEVRVARRVAPAQ